MALFVLSSSAHGADDAESTDPGCITGEAGWSERLTIRVHGEVSNLRAQQLSVGGFGCSAHSLMRLHFCSLWLFLSKHLAHLLLYYLNVHSKMLLLLNATQTLHTDTEDCLWATNSSFTSKGGLRGNNFQWVSDLYLLLFDCKNKTNLNNSWLEFYSRWVECIKLNWIYLL